MGDGVFFISLCMSHELTHGVLLSPGTQEKCGVKNGLKTFKNRYKLQISQQINMMCSHSDEGKVTILALGAEKLASVTRVSRQKAP